MQTTRQKPMPVVGFLAMRMFEPLRFNLQLLCEGEITPAEVEEYLLLNRKRLRAVATQCLNLTDFHAAIAASAAELVNFHGQMRRSANENGEPIEQVELRWVRGEARRVAQEFGASEDHIFDVLADILIQYTTQEPDRPRPSALYLQFDHDITLPEGLERGW